MNAEYILCVGNKHVVRLSCVNYPTIKWMGSFALKANDAKRGRNPFVCTNATAAAGLRTSDGLIVIAFKLTLINLLRLIYRRKGD